MKTWSAGEKVLASDLNGNFEGNAANKIVILDSSSRLPAVDGSQLTGILVTLTASANIKAAADTEQSAPGSTPVKKKEFVINGKGTIRVYVDAKASTYWSGNYVMLYKNGAFVANIVAPTASYVTYSYDLSVVSGDLVQIYLGGNQSGYSIYVKNVKIAYDRQNLTECGVNLN